MPSIRHKRKTFAIVLAAVLVIAAFGAGLHLVEKHFQGKESGPGDNGGRGNPTNQEHRIKIDYDTYVYTDDIETYLLFGTDDDGTARKGKKGFNGAMADAIALLIVNNTSEKYAFIQIDRNTMTDVPILDENGEPNGTANEQLCIAHWYGQNEEQRNRNMVNTVSYVLGGLDIDGYFALDMRDIGKLNHAIGGVAVDIETDMTKVDPEFKKGETVLLSDEQAEKYLRARMYVGNGLNEGRQKRQKQYAQKAYNIMIGQVRENPDYINELYQEMSDVIESDLSEKDVSVIANNIRQYTGQGFFEFTGEHMIDDTFADGVRYEELYLNYDSVVRALSKVINLKVEGVESNDNE